MGPLNLTGKGIKNSKGLAIFDPVLQCDYPTIFYNFDILASDFNNFKLLIKESLLIKHDRPVWNRTIKSVPLDLFCNVFSV